MSGRISDIDNDEIKTLMIINEQNEKKIKHLSSLNNEYQNEINNLKTQILKLKIEIDDFNFQLKLADSQRLLNGKENQYRNIVFKKENEFIISKSKTIEVKHIKSMHNKSKSSYSIQKQLFENEKEHLIKLYEEKNKNKDNEISQLKKIIEENTKFITNSTFENRQLELNLQSEISKTNSITNILNEVKKENIKLSTILEDKEQQLNTITKTYNQFESNYKEIQKLYKTYQYKDNSSIKQFNVSNVLDIQKLINNLLSINNLSISSSFKNLIDCNINNIEIISSNSKSNKDMFLFSQSDSAYIEKIKHLENNLSSAKELIASLKKDNQQTTSLLKENIEQKKQFLDIKTIYTQLQSKIISMITSISPTLISLDFTSNEHFSIPIDKYIDLLSKFSEDISKKEGKQKKYKEMLQKLSRVISEQKKEISYLISNKKEIINHIIKFDSYIANTVKDKLSSIDFENQDESLIIQTIEKIMEELFDEEQSFKSTFDILITEDNNINESLSTNKSFITNSSLNDSSSQ